MALLYANENFPLQVVQVLRVLGHDVLTTSEAGNANQSTPDEEVLGYATQNQRALLSLNKRDFIRLHNKNQDHAGIIICSQDIDVAGQAERIHQALSSMAFLAGQLIRVHRPQR